MPSSQYKASPLSIFVRVMAIAFAVGTSPKTVLSGQNICDAAASFAARETNVPHDVLQAITRVETGRTQNGVVSPWPWAINAAGESFWFTNENQALSAAYRKIKEGKRNVDIGCFQINYRWHGGEFTSLEDMFDPKENALYAARFLNALFLELGDWEEAAGAYHSRTEKYATRYRARFREAFARLDLHPNAEHPNPKNTASLGSVIGAAFDTARSPGSLVSLPESRTALY